MSMGGGCLEDSASSKTTSSDSPQNDQIIRNSPKTTREFFAAVRPLRERHSDYWSGPSKLGSTSAAEGEGEDALSAAYHAAKLQRARATISRLSRMEAGGEGAC